MSIYFGKESFAGGSAGKLRSLVEIRMSPDRFVNFWQSTQNGFETDTAAIVAQWISVQAPPPPSLEQVEVANDRVHSDWASVAQIARTGGMASIDFYYVPPREVLRAQGVRQIELRGYATGGGDDEVRKLALVRTLAVRMYLIDQGVKARIEVAAQAASAKGGGAKDRVDIMTP